MDMLYEREPGDPMNAFPPEDSDGAVVLMRAQINQCTELTLSAIPVSYNVHIGSALVYPCNLLENAKRIFHTVRADLKGEAYDG